LVRIAVPSITAAALIGLWAVITHFQIVPAFVLPSPINVVRALVRELPAMAPHVVVTVHATLAGLAIATGSAILLTFLMAVSRIVRVALYPLLVVSQTVPLIALAPLFVIWFGFGLLPKVLVVALVCFFPVVISLMEGVAAVDADTVNLLRSMGAGRWQLFTRAHVPASIPALFSGLRIAATYSVMGAVIGEWLGGSSGLGVYMIRAQKAFALERVFAAIVVIVALSLGIFAVIVAVQRIASPWRSVTEGRAMP
jgi:ABC-type nitrate/sulfonate/bicarbonate transport system permease component